MQKHAGVMIATRLLDALKPQARAGNASAADPSKPSPHFTPTP